MAKPKNFATLLDGQFSDIKLDYEGPSAEIKVITGCDAIGEGTYGRVIQVEYNGAACAARVLNQGLTIKGKSSREELYLSNCQKCMHLRHPNITQVFGVFCNSPPSEQLRSPPIQVMERMAYSLTSYVECQSGSEIPFPRKLSILHDVAAGLTYLHCRKPRPIVHCYLSSNNVLLTTAQQAKISDVGLAQMFKGHRSTSKAKVFMAPEMASKPQAANDNADPLVDVYSYGAVLLHTITQQWPELPSTSSNCKEGWEGTNKVLVELRDSCLSNTPRSRPNMTNVLAEVKTIIKNQDAPKLEAKHEFEQDMNNVIKDKKGLQEEHDQPGEKEWSDEIPMTQNLEAVGKLSNEFNDHQDQDKQNSSKSNIQQDQDKEQNNSGNMYSTCDQASDPACRSYANTDDQLNQDSRKDDVTDQQYHLQNNNDNEDCDAKVKNKLDIDGSHHDKVQHDISTTVGHSSLNKHVPKVIDGKESTYIKQKRKGSLEQCKHPDESQNSTDAQTDVKDNDPMSKGIVEQFDVTQQKQDETCSEGKNENIDVSRRDSQQGKHRKRRKKHQGKAHNSSTDHEKNENSDPNVVDKDDSQTKKGQHSASAAKSNPYKFNELGPKVIGFHNQGNTCYFNAMLQSIHQTTGLHHAVAEGKRVYKIENTIKGPLSIEVSKNSGELTVQLRRLFGEISKRSGSILPQNLLQVISKKNSRFAHGTQEDSHEVLRYLLSALRDEEIECMKQEILALHGTRGECLTDKCVDGEAKLYLKDCLSKASKGICNIDCIFGSHLISTTICHECETPLQTTEFHFDFSLPLPEETSHDKASGHSGASSRASRKKRGKHKKGATAQVQNHALIPEVKRSSEIPKVVKSQQDFNLYLQKKDLSHCSILDPTDLKLETTLEHCLLAYTSLDTLDENNKFICHRCSYPDGRSDVVPRCVSKQILIHKLSPVLILHIKRFIIGSHRVTKNNHQVSFPRVLNMSPFCTAECVKELGDVDRKILYGLYAVVEHNGSLHNGHYVTYVRRRPVHNAKDHSSGSSATECSMQGSSGEQKRKYDQNAAEVGEWHCTNDSCVSKCNWSKVYHCQPYLLFYELLPFI